MVWELHELAERSIISKPTAVSLGHRKQSSSGKVEEIACPHAHMAYHAGLILGALIDGFLVRLSLTEAFMQRQPR